MGEPRKFYDWDTIFKEYSNLHAQAIARKIGSTANVVIFASRRKGITLVVGKKGSVAKYPWKRIFREEIASSIVDIAYKYKIPIETVSRAVKKYNVNISYSHYSRLTTKRYNWEEIFRLNPNKNATQISLLCGANRTTVASAAKRLDQKLPNGKKVKKK